MNNQLQFDLSTIEKVKGDKYNKQKWRNKLQEYCDIQAQTEGQNSGWCVCGEMAYCDNCEHLGKKNGCVKSIVKFCEENHIAIDTNNYNFEELLKKIENKKRLDKNK